MNIDPISSYSPPGIRPGQMQNISANAAVPDMDVTDSFKLAGDTKIDGLNAAELSTLVMATDKINKDCYSFRVRNMEEAPDGTTYIAYNDWERKDGNYITSMNAEGNYNWDARVGKNHLESMKVGPDGTVYARSKKDLTAFGADGFPKFCHHFEEEVKEHWIDANGNNFFIEDRRNDLYMVTPEGAHVELPEKLQGLRPDEMKMTADGTAWCRTGETFRRVDFGKGEEISHFDFKDPSPERKAYAQGFFPTSDGGVLVHGRHRQVIFTPGSGNDPTYFGGPLKGMGMKFPAPDLGDLNPKPNADTNYIFKLDKNGAIEWKSREMGERPLMESTPDGGTLFTNNKLGSRHQLDIFKLAPDGTETKFATFDDYVSDFKVRPNDGSLFVKLGDTIAQVQPDGAKQEKTFDEDMRIFGFDKAGKVLLTDKQGGDLYRWDPETDDLKPLSDHKNDYSYKIQLQRIEKERTEKNETGAGTIEHTDEAVIVDGVELSKKKKKKIK